MAQKHGRYKKKREPKQIPGKETTSICSSEETINFYLAMGCRLSPHPIPEMVAEEPWDLQPECKLGWVNYK